MQESFFFGLPGAPHHSSKTRYNKMEKHPQSFQSSISDCPSRILLLTYQIAQDVYLTGIAQEQLGRLSAICGLSDASLMTFLKVFEGNVFNAKS